jgi:hypothetical protein
MHILLWQVEPFDSRLTSVRENPPKDGSYSCSGMHNAPNGAGVTERPASHDAPAVPASDDTLPFAPLLVSELPVPLAAPVLTPLAAPVPAAPLVTPEPPPLLDPDPPPLTVVVPHPARAAVESPAVTASPAKVVRVVIPGSPSVKDRGVRTRSQDPRHSRSTLGNSCRRRNSWRRTFCCRPDHTGAAGSPTNRTPKRSSGRQPQRRGERWRASASRCRPR